MIKKWLNTPITWKGYFKMCGICGIFGSIYCIWLYVKLGLIELDEIKNFFKKETED